MRANGKVVAVLLFLLCVSVWLCRPNVSAYFLFCQPALSSTDNNLRPTRPPLPTTTRHLSGRHGNHNASSKREPKALAAVAPRIIGHTVDGAPIPAADANDVGTRYLKHAFLGRLGNVMFQLASLVCVAKINNMTLLVRDHPELVHFRRGEGGLVVVEEDVFEDLDVAPVKEMVHFRCGAFAPRMMTLSRDRPGFSVSLWGFFQSWKFFQPCGMEAALRVVEFTPEVRQRAVEILLDLRRSFPSKTLVAVHVRMDHYANPELGKNIAPADYFRKAMTYFRDRFRDVVFLVNCPDPEWYKTNVTSSADVTYLQRSDSPAVDLEVLSGLDHVIVSVGTFGWWVGYRSRGTVVYFKDFFVPDTRFARNFPDEAADYVYPSWVPM